MHSRVEMSCYVLMSRVSLVASLRGDTYRIPEWSVQDPDADVSVAGDGSAEAIQRDQANVRSQRDTERADESASGSYV